MCQVLSTGVPVNKQSPSFHGVYLTYMSIKGEPIYVYIDGYVYMCLHTHTYCTCMYIYIHRHIMYIYIHRYINIHTYIHIHTYTLGGDMS